MKRTGYLLLFLLAALLPTSLLAATGRILDETEAHQADPAALTAEVELFKSIGMGIALALSQCEGQSGCNPSVNEDELGHLLKTLDRRIDDLVLRQENKEGDYTEVITAYVNQREAYHGYQADLEKITGGAAGEEDMGAETFGETGTTVVPEAAPSEAATAAEVPHIEIEESGRSDVDLDVFSDVDQPIQ